MCGWLQASLENANPKQKKGIHNTHLPSHTGGNRLRSRKRGGGSKDGNQRCASSAKRNARVTEQATLPTRPHNKTTIPRRHTSQRYPEPSRTCCPKSRMRSFSSREMTSIWFPPTSTTGMRTGGASLGRSGSLRAWAGERGFFWCVPQPSLYFYHESFPTLSRWRKRYTTRRGLSYTLSPRSTSYLYMPKNDRHHEPLTVGDGRQETSRASLPLPQREQVYLREWTEKTKKEPKNRDTCCYVQSEAFCEPTYLRRGSTSGGSSGLGIMDTECGYHVCPNRAEGKEGGRDVDVVTFLCSLFVCWCVVLNVLYSQQAMRWSMFPRNQHKKTSSPFSAMHCDRVLDLTFNDHRTAQPHPSYPIIRSSSRREWGEAVLL